MSLEKQPRVPRLRNVSRLRQLQKTMMQIHLLYLRMLPSPKRSAETNLLQLRNPHRTVSAKRKRKSVTERHLKLR